jgi:hypothetical protein
MKTLHAQRILVLLVVAVVTAGAAGCSERESDLPNATSTDLTGLPSSASPSAKVIGVAPAEASSDTAQTTPVSAEAKTDVEQKEKSYPMPWPGQPNDHSNLAPNPSQKAESVEPRPAEGQAAPSNEQKADPYRSTK